MRTKTCVACGREQDISNFFIVRRKGKAIGWRSHCRDCCTIRQRRYRLSDPDGDAIRKHRHYLLHRDAILEANAAYLKTPKGWAGMKWSSLNARTINGSSPDWENEYTRKYYLEKKVRLEMTREELVSFAESQWDKILAIWKYGGVPSIDRIDSTGHYALANIRIISLAENSLKAGGLAKMQQLQKKATRDAQSPAYPQSSDPASSDSSE